MNGKVKPVACWLLIIKITAQTAKDERQSSATNPERK